ncbi:hypothetical protein Tsubulata_025897 [Turnera subulata]|uniref:DUF7722 domain-containing protein n=1 Tax=Turnera subulata TaxID=218843 RepID=A0A9Q0GK23_9ROSI|nr:hypothetical protein Tsubulata_025897 [Turnera subulata]
MESKKKLINNGGASVFQMPLHYPRYTQKDYEIMQEYQLDRLLKEYGLPTNGDLAYKRKFAMGAFLWPTYHDQEPTIPDSSLHVCYPPRHSPPYSKQLIKIVDFVYRMLGLA